MSLICDYFLRNVKCRVIWTMSCGSTFDLNCGIYSVLGTRFTQIKRKLLFEIFALLSLEFHCGFIHGTPALL